MRENVNTQITPFDFVTAVAYGTVIGITFMSFFATLKFLIKVDIEHQSTMEIVLTLLTPLIVPMLVFIILTIILFKLDKLFVKTTSVDVDTKLPIRIEDGSFITVPTSKTSSIRFTIKKRDDSLEFVGLVKRVDVKLSETEMSYMLKRTTKTTKTLFGLSGTEEHVKYLLYLKPKTFKSLCGTLRETITYEELMKQKENTPE